MSESILRDKRKNLYIPDKLDIAKVGSVDVGWGAGTYGSSVKVYHRLGFIPMVLAYYNRTRHWSGSSANTMQPLPNIGIDSNGKITYILYTSEITDEYVEFSLKSSLNTLPTTMFEYVRYYLLKQKAYGK